MYKPKSKNEELKELQEKLNCFYKQRNFKKVNEIILYAETIYNEQTLWN